MKRSQLAWSWKASGRTRSSRKHNESDIQRKETLWPSSRQPTHRKPSVPEGSPRPHEQIGFMPWGRGVIGKRSGRSSPGYEPEGAKVETANKRKDFHREIVCFWSILLGQVKGRDLQRWNKAIRSTRSINYRIWKQEVSTRADDKAWAIWKIRRNGTGKCTSAPKNTSSLRTN